MAFFLSLTAGTVAGIEQCKEPNLCTGAIGSAGMCGTQEEFQTGAGCGGHANCQAPTIIPHGFALGAAGPGQVRARLLVEIVAPWNAFAGDPLRGDDPNSTLDVLWFEEAGEAPEPWTDPPGATSICENLHSDRVFTWIEKTASCADIRSGLQDSEGALLVYSLRASTCGGPCTPPYFPDCGAFCGRWADKNGLAFQVPPEELNAHCPRMDPCECREDGSQVNWACPSGQGPDVLPAQPGPQAFLRYAAGGVGAPNTPGAALWAPQLGRFWSHDYAERLVAGADPLQIWFITREAVYRAFWDLDGDGLYDRAVPEDEERELRRNGTGWDLVDLDGTVQSFDAQGRWLRTQDPHGNAKVGTYAGDQLLSVTMPDGRREDFTYHADGKLASIAEVGTDSSTTRTWRYNWQGDDLVRIERPDGTAWSFRYDDPALPGYMTRMTLVGTDGSERVEGAWEYDPKGNVVRAWRGAASADSGVELYSFSYAAPQNPVGATMTDPLGKISTFAFKRDPASNKPLLLSASGDCPSCGLGPNLERAYEDETNPLLPTREVDGRGTVTLMGYDQRGQLTSKTEAFGTALQRTTTWEYAGPFPGLPTAIEQPSTAGGAERRTMMAYDATGTLVARTVEGVEAGSAFSLTTVTTPNPAGQPEAVDPPGYGDADVTRFAYDPGRGDLLPLSRTDPLIGTMSFAYDAWNRRVSVIDANGVATTTSYDLLDRVVEIRQEGATASEDLVTTYEYGPFGDLTRTILPRGNVIENTYDGAGRLISIERKADLTTAGERTVYTLDNYGHRIREELQRWTGAGWVTDSSTSYRYSSRCHLDAVLHPDGSQTEYAYDCNGNLEQMWDANHPSDDRSNPSTQTYGYDALDRLTSVSQPWAGAGGGQAITRYEYDVQDHLVKVADAEDNLTRYSYSDRDLMTRQESEVSGTTEYRYNEHGELASETDARGVTVTRTVDALDRVAFIDYPEDALDTRHTYDDPLVPFSKGRLTALIRGGTSVAYRYDRLGRLTQDGPLTYVHDSNGNLSEIGYPGGVKVSKTFDFADREESLTLFEPGYPARAIASGATYLALGPLASVTLGNGVVETRGFDARYFPAQIEASRGGTPLLDWRYTTDKIGNILSIGDQVSPVQGREFDYQDVAYFLTQGNGPWGNQSWTYDKIGNRLTETRNGSTNAYSYLSNSAGGRNPKLLEVTGPNDDKERFFYDAIGDQTYRVTGEEKLRFDYNTERRLSQIRGDEADEAPAAVNFTYDGRSFLETALFTPHIGHELQIKTQASYSSEGVLHHRFNEVLPSVSGARREPGKTTDSYVLYFADRPIAILDRIATVDPTTGRTESRRLLYITTDHLGTPALATDETGNTIWSGGFEPFGADYSGAQANGVFLGFPGQWKDTSWANGSLDSALYQNLARFLESSTARYTSPDPLIDIYRSVLLGPPYRFVMPQEVFGTLVASAEVHHYSYAKQAPTVLFDSTGLAAQRPRCDCINKQFENSWTLECCLCHDACFARYGCSALANWPITIYNVVTHKLPFAPDFPYQPCDRCNVWIANCFLSDPGGRLREMASPGCPWEIPMDLYPPPLPPPPPPRLVVPTDPRFWKGRGA